MMHDLNNPWQQGIAVCLLLFILCAGSAQAQPSASDQAPATPQIIGEIALAKGVVTARSEQRAITSLAKGSPVYLNDILETASRSFAVITFTDGGKITLRPETRLDIKKYVDTPGQEEQSFELLKGGLRAVTGAIGKARPENVTYTAQNTTIGIRGTILVIKLCDATVDGCNADNKINQQAGLGEEASSKKYVEIFIVDKDGGTRRKITREQLSELLVGLYVSVIEGAIRIESDSWFIDMVAGDKCLVDQYDDSGTMREGNDIVECFAAGQGLEDIDVYLGEDAENISMFNLYDGGEMNVGSELCEIN